MSTWIFLIFSVLLTSASFAQPLTLNINSVNPTCGFNNGSITATASGGTAPYRYFKDGYPFGNGYFPNEGDGTYVISVTDAVGATTQQTVTLTELRARPDLVATTTIAASCSGLDGQVTLMASGGLPPYTYSTTYEGPYQSSNVFNNMGPGRYLFYVKDAYGCIGGTTYYDVEADNCPIYIGGVTANSFIFCSTDGFIRLFNISGGTPPYTFSLDGVNYQASGEFNGLAGGLYVIRVKDAVGVMITRTFFISHSCSVVINAVSVDAACEANDGQLTVSPLHGAPPYEYSMDGVNYQSSNVFTGLYAGNYNLTVRDAGGYMQSTVATIYDRCPQVFLSSTGEGCSGNDGTITAHATKGTAPYSYSIDGVNFQSSNIFTGLTTGSYTVTMRDALNFTATASTTLFEACINVSAFGIDSRCGQDNGVVSIIATDGVPPYQYSIDGTNFQGSGVFSSLPPGTYSITVRDNLMQTGTAQAVVGETPGPTVSMTTTAAGCPGNNATVTLNPSGGTGPYQYSLDGLNFQSSNLFTGLTPGSYTGTVRDLFGCIATSTITAIASCPLPAFTAVNETCNGGNGGINATASGGSPPYLFSLDGVSFQASGNFPNLAAGSYTVYVKDQLGVTNTTTAVIQNICPTVSVVITDGLCSNTAGAINATGAEGTAPYTFSLDNINYQASGIFNNLASATYTVFVKDANGLINSTSAVVQNYPGPQVTVAATSASCLDNDGVLTATGSGGTGALQYSIDGLNFVNTSVFHSLAQGNYNLYVKDVNGCTANTTSVITITDNLVLTVPDAVSICEGQGILLSAASNGSNFTWTPAGTISDPTILSPTASPSSTTKYFVTALLGVCSKKDSISVNVSPAPVAYAGLDSTICFGKAINLTGSGGSSFSWSPSVHLSAVNVPNPLFGPADPGIYTYNLSVTNAEGCSSLQADQVIVKITSPASLFAGPDTSIVMNAPFQLNAIDVNNSGFSSYTWTPATGLNNSMIQAPVVTINRDMVYTVRAMTDAGCAGEDMIHIRVYKGPDIFVPTAFTPNGDGKNDVLKVTSVGIREFRFLAIYNRGGELVFRTKDPGAGWNGTLKGASQPAEVFVWICEGVDDTGKLISKRGTVTLIR